MFVNFSVKIQGITKSQKKKASMKQNKRDKIAWTWSLLGFYYIICRIQFLFHKVYFFVDFKQWLINLGLHNNLNKNSNTLLNFLYQSRK